MNPQEGFRLHPAAVEDIIEIWEYVAKDNVRAAGRFREELFDAIQKLSVFPDMGSVRPRLSGRAIRFWGFYDYLIAYMPDEKPLWVIAIVHGRRDPRLIATILRERAERG
jgi:toxin ParE1/3/4